MIDRVLLLERVVRAYQSNYVYKDGVNLTPNFLNNNDFAALASWAAILKSFKMVCKDKEGRTTSETGIYGTITRVFLGLTYIHDEITIIINSYETFISDEYS